MESAIADQRNRSPTTIAPFSISTTGELGSSDGIQTTVSQAISPSTLVYPLGISITLYRFSIVALGLGLGIPKAVCAARGQSVIAGYFDWAGGLAAIVYVRPHYVKRASELIPLIINLQLVCLWLV